MERVHHVRLSRGLSDEEDENDSLASLDGELEETSLDGELEETTLPSEEGLEREEEGEGQRQGDRFGLNE